MSLVDRRDDVIVDRAVDRTAPATGRTDNRETARRRASAAGSARSESAYVGPRDEIVLVGTRRGRRPRCARYAADSRSPSGCAVRQPRLDLGPAAIGAHVCARRPDAASASSSARSASACEHLRDRSAPVAARQEQIEEVGAQLRNASVRLRDLTSRSASAPKVVERGARARRRAMQVGDRPPKSTSSAIHVGTPSRSRRVERRRIRAGTSPPLVGDLPRMDRRAPCEEARHASRRPIAATARTLAQRQTAA